MERGWVEMSHLEGAEVTNDSRFTGVNDGRVDDDGACRIYMESSQECPNEALYVQDDYEVKNSVYEDPVVFTEGVGNSLRFISCGDVSPYFRVSWEGRFCQS